MSANGDWIKLKKGLEDRQWDFRTIEGLAKEFNMPKKKVEELLNLHRSEVRKTLDGRGRVLYTMAKRPIKFREFLANTQAIISKY